MIKILQSTVEKLLYILLLLVFIANIILIIITVNIFNSLKTQQQSFHKDSASSLVTIKQNQVNETVAVKTYIDCLLHINPQGNLPAQETICFNKAPVVKP